MNRLTSHALLSRRSALKLGAAAALAASPLPKTHPSLARAQGGEVHIGSQKGAASLLVLKAQGALEKRLGEIGVNVTWTEFPAGVVLLEGLNAGAIDFGLTGAPPAIFAQAAGADLIYVLSSKPAPDSQAIIVPPDSPIQKPADLAGKKVAVAKGSSTNALLVRALEAGGLKWGDAEAVFLLPADSKAAFEGGSVDAWSIWDPYYAAEQKGTNARDRHRWQHWLAESRLLPCLTRLCHRAGGSPPDFAGDASRIRKVAEHAFAGSGRTARDRNRAAGRCAAAGGIAPHLRRRADHG